MCGRPEAAIPPGQPVRHGRQYGDLMDAEEGMAALVRLSG